MRPRILVTLGVFPELLERLGAVFEVEDNQSDCVFSPAELADRLRDKDGALITGYDRIDASLLEACPRLRAVCNLAVGYNNMDLSACTARGIIATNTPDVLNDTTADLAFGLLLAAARRITEAERWLRGGHWQGWRNDQMLGQDVHHATLGIVGMGQIGRAIARRARGFDMRIIYHNRGRAPADLERALDAQRVELDELLGLADFVCLALPYSPQTHHLIDARRLGLMKPSAILVNVGRGGLVDDGALVEALRTRRIAGAGLDVYENEPALHAGFLALDNVALTPHIGSATRATRMEMGSVAAENLVSALSGRRPPNLLNPQVWEHRRS